MKKFNKLKKIIGVCLTGIVMLGFGFGLCTQYALADWTNGKFDAAMDFNGTSDFIFAGDIGEDVKTILFWIKADDISDRKIIDLDAGEHYIKVDTDVSAPGFVTPIIYVDGVVGTTIDTNWHFVAITTTTAITADSVYLGRVFITPDNYYFDGVLDDVKFYDRVLTALEIAEHYRQKSPSMAQGGTISASSSSTALTVEQSGSGDLVHLSATGSGTMANGLVIEQTSDGTITDAIDVSDENITNALNVGSNIITGSGYAMSGVGNMTFSDSPTLKLGAVSGNFAFTDSEDNSLMTLTDAGTTGNLNITGTLTVSGGTFDVSGAATDIEIIDNTASAFTISQSTNEYFNITTDDTNTTFLIDLPVAGATSTIANLFTGNVAKTINLGTGTGIDTINIGTDATAADLISIGSSGAGNVVIESAAALTLTGLAGSLINFSNFDVATSGATSIIPTTDVAPLAISRNVAAAANNLLSITESAADATGTALFINQGGTGSIADFQSSASSILTVQDADRLKMRDKTLLAIGDINEAIIDDMEAIADWAESDDGNTDVSLEESIVRVNDGAMKITTDQGSITAATIAFLNSDPDTITDTGDGFTDAGFHAGDVIDITGSTSNDGSYTIDTGGVADGVLTLIGADTLTAEVLGDTVTIIGHASNTDTITNTFSSNQNYSVNDRIGFWVRATESGQIFTIKINDTAPVISTHAVTIDAANRWQYEEWDISGIASASRDVVDYVQFYIDDDTGSPTIYIDQLRYYDKDDRSGEMFVDGDGHLVLAGEQGIELQANITSSLPGLSINSAIVEVNQPFSVNVAGDTGINYDLQFLNTGSTFVTSAGPLVIAAGDPNHSENLTITTQSNISGGDSGRATAGDTTTLTDSTKASTWTANEWQNGTISIVSGTGASQTQTVASNTDTVITVADWDSTAGDPDANSYYTLNYARGGDVLVNIGQTHLEIGGFKILGSDSGSYVFKVSADGDVEIGGAGLGGSDLLVKQNISLTGGNLTIGQLDISEAGTLATSETIDASGSCSADQYWYVVVAVNDNGTTAYGGEDDITTVDDDPTVTISWDPVEGATGYKLYRNIDDDWTDDDDSWVDGKVISSLETTYTDDCTGDTDTQTPPTTNTTGGDVIATGDFKKTCADGYIWVPGSAKYGTLPGFCVMKYEARCTTGFSADNYVIGDCDNYTSIPYATDTAITSLPWNVVSQKEARAKCLAIGAGYHLMSDEEWMTIAENIANTTINDMDDAASIQLAGGHNDALDFGNASNGIANLAAADPVVSGCDITENMAHADNAYDVGVCEIRGPSGDGSLDADEKGFYDTGDNWAVAYGAGAENKSQLRTHILSNGEVIWDIAGNYWEWTDKMIYEDRTDGSAANDGNDAEGCTAEMPDTSESETYVYKSKIVIENPTADDDAFFEEIADAVTFTSIYCKTLVGTVNLDVQIAGSGINGGDITCTTAGVLDDSLAGDTAGAVGEELKLAITSVAEAPAPTYLMVQINGISVSGETVQGWEEYTSIVDFKGLSIRPPDDGWVSANGIGQIYITPGHAYSGVYDSSYHAFLRGGYWNDTSHAGVFALTLILSPALSPDAHLGFRCSR